MPGIIFPSYEDRADIAVSLDFPQQLPPATGPSNMRFISASSKATGVQSPDHTTDMASTGHGSGKMPKYSMGFKRGCERCERGERGHFTHVEYI